VVRHGRREGDARSQLHLGWLYFEGKGVSADPMLAYMWSNLAAAQLSGEERSAAEKQRDYIATKLKPAQLSKAHSWRAIGSRRNSVQRQSC
jgi:TPR repeat protein